jgi:Zn-dependent protease with chaperone function
MLEKDRLSILKCKILMRTLLAMAFAGMSLLVSPSSETYARTSASITDDAKLVTKEPTPKAAPSLNAKTSAKEPTANRSSTDLLEQVQAWAKIANFWKLVERGERLAARIEVLSVKSNALEAWVCGQTKICASSRLLREFTPEAQQAVVAHELGHFLIPRNYEAHPQLWEAQCDLFAVAFLRDAEQMKEMLYQLGNNCATCQDRDHPVPKARAALIECNAATPLTEILKFDELRQRSFAVHFQEKQHGVPRGLQQLNFALKNAFTASGYLGELKALDFAIRFNQTTRKR